MNSKVTGEGAAADDGDVKKVLAIFTYNQCLLSIDMRVSENLNIQIFEFLVNLTSWIRPISLFLTGQTWFTC